jgi:hypothetical protein
MTAARGRINLADPGSPEKLSIPVLDKLFKRRPG